jgi:TATA-binding protein-associated factor Taf7
MKVDRQPQDPAGPPRAEGRKSPSPVASGSGAQTAKSAKKRKRETGPEEISEAEARKANSHLKIEMAMIASRATDLEHTVAEHQECLDEATNAVSRLVEKEERL